MGESESHRNAVNGDMAREMGELYRILVDSVLDYAIFALDPHGNILTWNAGAERLKGYTADEVIGQHFSIFYPPERISERFPDFELRTAAAVGRFEDEGWRVRKNGTRFWANVIITALRDSNGELIGFAKVTRDLTARKAADTALRQSEQAFRLLVEGVKDYAIFMLDPSGRVATWNEGAERIKGYRRDEIIGKSFSTFYPPEDIAVGKPDLELEIARREGKYEEEGWRLRRDGTMLWASVLITALYNDSGELVGFAKVTRDLTERRAAEQRALRQVHELAAEEFARQQAEQRSDELQQAHQRAEEANRAKGQFLAAMSHELRTPLNAIGGYADLLMMGLSGSVTPQQAEQLARIKRSQEHLLGIINDILNFSRIEAGQLQYASEPVPLCDVMTSVIEMTSPQLKAKRLDVEAADANHD
ncbi:MAG: sensor protein, partial [Gemmatimonadetes bacterium]|nr:sensor protein [Gemmatimonadota bacterium]